MDYVISIHFEEVTGIEKFFELIGFQGLMFYFLIHYKGLNSYQSSCP
jgi:hypothetical protein